MPTAKGPLTRPILTVTHIAVSHYSSERQLQMRPIKAS